MQYYQNPFQEVRGYFSTQPMLLRLILINVGVWLIISLVRVFGFLLNYPDDAVSGAIVDLLALPAHPGVLLSKPWTLLTYMFLHIEFFHILFNMLWLYWFGRIFLEFLNSRQLLATYIFGGLAGGLLFVVFYNIFPVFASSVNLATALGASAAVMAIVTAISFYVPNYSIYLFLLGKVKIIYIAIALFVIDFFMIRSSNAGGHIAHIGGALYGFLYVLVLRKGIDFSRIFSNLKFRKTGRTKQHINLNGDLNDHGRPMTDEEYNIRKIQHQEKIDHILDKIAKSGYESLSKEEKEFLFKSSNNN
jgi:membrane associated rhomboid family serine protease